MANFSSGACRILLNCFCFVSGEDGKKFKTRSGETVKLSDLLLEAVRIAGESIRKRRADEGGEGYQASLRFTYLVMIRQILLAFGVGKGNVAVRSAGSAHGGHLPRNRMVGDAFTMLPVE